MSQLKPDPFGERPKTAQCHPFKARPEGKCPKVDKNGLKTTYFIYKWPYLIITNPALGIEEEILFVRDEQKDCNVKPDPQGTPKSRQNFTEKPNKNSDFLWDRINSIVKL